MAKKKPKAKPDPDKRREWKGVYGKTTYFPSENEREALDIAALDAAMGVLNLKIGSSEDLDTLGWDSFRKVMNKAEEAMRKVFRDFEQVNPKVSAYIYNEEHLLGSAIWGQLAWDVPEPFSRGGRSYVMFGYWMLYRYLKREQLSNTEQIREFFPDEEQPNG